MKELGTRRAQVLRATIDVLAEQGPSGLTHRSVDERAGVPGGTTSNHFRTRDQLLVGALDYTKDTLHQKILKLDEGGPGAEKGLAAYLTGVMRRAFDDKRRLTLAWCRAATEGTEDADVKEAVADSLEGAVDRLVTPLAACGSASARADAYAVVGYLQGLTIVRFATGYPSQVDERIMGSFVRGLLRSDRPRSRRRRPASPASPELPDPDASRRVRVVDAAMDVLVRKGFRGLTHRNVDRCAGLPAGTTSNHFRTHRALVDAVQERTIMRTATSANIALRRLPRTGAALRKFLETTIAHGLSDDVVRGVAMAMFLMEAATNENVADKTAGSVDLWCAGYTRWAVEAGSTDPALHGQLVYPFMLGMFLMHHLCPRPDLDPTVGVEPFVWGLLHG